jgi:hypothetical protein
MEDHATSTIDHDNAVETPFSHALRRARAEFLEMPGLQLTESQAARLWAVDSDLCRAVLSALVECRFLVRTRSAFFAKA